MSFGVGLFLVAIGAILTFAVVDPTVGNLNLRAVGVILMAVGVGGVAITMLVWNRYALSRRGVRLIERELPGGRVIERELPPGPVVQRGASAPRVIQVKRAADGGELLAEREVPPPPPSEPAPGPRRGPGQRAG